MTMINCSECGKNISDKASVCIGCGAPISTINLDPFSDTSPIPIFTKICDLNGDGKVDYEDFKIAAAKARNIASATADEAVKLGKEALRSDMTKDAAAGAAVGAAIAVPIPLIGPALGAAVGAGVGVFKNFTKK